MGRITEQADHSPEWQIVSRGSKAALVSRRRQESWAPQEKPVNRRNLHRPKQWQGT
jgi:hypothetical protein